MAESLFIAVGLVSGMDWRILALVAVTFWFPFLGVAALVVHMYQNRRGPDLRSALFCQSVARELRSGANLRTALIGASVAVDASEIRERLEGGESVSSAIPVLASEFVEIGVELATVVDSVLVSGASSAGLFEELGDLALAQVEIAEEIRVATAPAQASAFVLIGLPVVYLFYQFASGRLRDLLVKPVQQGLTVVGLVLIAFGVLVSWMIVRGVK